MPPTEVLSEKSTSLSATEPPVESTTRNTTVEVSLRFTPPVPCSEMLVGVADTNSMEPTEAGATLTVPVACSCRPVATAVAVITSSPEQPVAT